MKVTIDEAAGVMVYMLAETPEEEEMLRKFVACKGYLKLDEEDLQKVLDARDGVAVINEAPVSAKEFVQGKYPEAYAAIKERSGWPGMLHASNGYYIYIYEDMPPFCFGKTEDEAWENARKLLSTPETKNQ